MTGWAWATLGAFLLGALVNEFSDLYPWMARGVARWAAWHWTKDRDRAEGYAEEWTAVIDARPGKLLKLLTALGFACGERISPCTKRNATAYHGLPTGCVPEQIRCRPAKSRHRPAGSVFGGATGSGVVLEEQGATGEQ